MAFFGIIPFGEDQLRGMSGDRSRFYLEDEVEEVQDPSWLQTGVDRLGRLGRNTAEGLGMMFGGDATAIGGPDRSNQFPFNVWNPKGHVGAGGGMADAQGNIIPTDAVRGNWPMTGESGTQIKPQLGTGFNPLDAAGAPPSEVGLITQSENRLFPGDFGQRGDNVLYGPAKPTSVAEAQAAGQKTFWSGDQEKLAVTAEQLADFKASEAYDAASGQSALSQWSQAWDSTGVFPEAPQAQRRGVREILIEEEGLKLTPYDDPGGGRRTVGVGHQLGVGEEERDVSDIEAMETLDTDISEAYDAVDRLSEKFDVGEIPSELRDELMMMAFQMGATGLSKFKKMWAAMKNQDWGEMVAQMADSRWAKSQTPERAARTIDRVATLMGV
jgi:lysozyme